MISLFAAYNIAPQDVLVTVVDVHTQESTEFNDPDQARDFIRVQHANGVDMDVWVSWQGGSDEADYTPDGYAAYDDGFERWLELPDKHMFNVVTGRNVRYGSYEHLQQPEDYVPVDDGTNSYPALCVRYGFETPDQHWYRRLAFVGLYKIGEDWQWVEVQPHKPWAFLFSALADYVDHIAHMLNIDLTQIVELGGDSVVISAGILSLTSVRRAIKDSKDHS